MANLEQTRRALSRVRRRLLERQNVVAAGIGYKITGGRRTDELAIVCSVSAKKPKRSLTRGDIVPSLVDGVRTDVIATGMISALSDRTARFRPAPGGVSLGHRLISAGTLGCLVKKYGRLHILSNNHVIANSNDALPGDSILQPGAADGGMDQRDQLATLREFVPIRFEQEAGTYLIAGTVAKVMNLIAAAFGSRARLKVVSLPAEENLVDCAIAEPQSPAEVSSDILGIGKIAGVAEASLSMPVVKSGRTTGVTRGIIEQIDVTVRVNFGSGRTALFVDQLMAGAMSQGGDSGSAVLDEDNNLVGLLFAGGPSTTVLNRIQHVMRELSISVV